MKKLLIIPILFFSLLLHATDYHFATAGNDITGDGSAGTPWQTITKANSLHPVAGDQILFNKGDTFYGTIIITHSGSVGSPIIYGAYGTGANPIITGFTIITGWTNEGSSIYSKVITSEAQTNMVTVDGINTGMGRYPDATYLTYTTATASRITDPELGASPDWDGAEVVINKNGWTLDRCLITAHATTTIDFTNLGSTETPNANRSYFIQNDLRCVTTTNEWYHSISDNKFYIYGDPSAKVVKVATLNNLLYNNGYDNITVDNITFEGSISANLNVYGYYVDNFKIQNCKVNFSGGYGMSLETCRNLIVDNNIVLNSTRTGISSNGTSNNIITNNTVTNTFMIEGSGLGVASSAIRMWAESGTGLVQYNNIDYAGYNGIYFIGNNVEIKNNFINHCLFIPFTNDGGGIYTGGANYLGRVIDRNIVINSGGVGIYLDEVSSNIQVTNNTAANSVIGLDLHKAAHNTVINNTMFNNEYNIWFQTSSAVDILHDNTLTGNIYFAKSSTQLALYFLSINNDIPQFGTSNNNYYARPVDDNNVFRTNDPSTGSTLRTLTEWITFTSQDADSKKSPITITDTSYIDFYYNATDEIVVKEIPYGSIDVTGAKYTIIGGVTLDAYESKVLMKDPTPNPLFLMKSGKVLMSKTGKVLTIIK
jgi:parallel beta-helix repeat protein